MKVLITGGAGFIGSNLVALLVQNGIDVRVLDSLVSGKRERLPSDTDFIKGDTRDKKALSGAIKDVTHVVHLAALVSVSRSMSDPTSTYDVNVVGTENVLCTMRDKGVRRFVYATSAAVYGDGPSLPKIESDELRPQSPYALSKVMNELQAEMYGRIFGLSTIGLRFFNVYGTGQEGSHPYASVIPRWIESIKAKLPVIVYGDGSQTRDFVHIRDVVWSIYCALSSDATGLYNIASGEETSLKDLQQIISSVYPKGFEARNEPAREGDILKSVADISLARSALGFNTTVELKKGIEELLNT